MSESVRGRRRRTRGRPFHTVGATTKQARSCIIVVRANGQTGLRATPSSMNLGSDYFEYLIQVDKGRLGKLEQGPIGTATPSWGDSILYTLSDRKPSKNLQHVTCYVTEFGCFTNRACCRVEYGQGRPGAKKASQHKATAKVKAKSNERVHKDSYSAS